MQIAICDDEADFRKELKEELLLYRNQKRIAIDIIEFENGNDLLLSKDIFDIVFIDYQMPGLNGLEVAKALRQRKCTCCIVFITSFPQFMIDSFEVQPFRFLIKPVDLDKLNHTLDDYIQQQKLLNPILIIEYGEQVTINSDNIIYLEADGKNCIIRTNDKTFRSSKTLSQLLNVLPEHCFFRIHKSYVINLYCIYKIKGNEVYLINGEKAIIGRNHIKEFKEFYRDFVKNYYVRL